MTFFSVPLASGLQGVLDLLGVVPLDTLSDAFYERKRRKFSTGKGQQSFM